MQISSALLLTTVLSFTSLCLAQEPPPASAPAQSAPPQSAPATANPPADSSSSGKRPRGPQGYLVTGTIFTERALAFANLRVQIRKAGEKKFRWETYTNSRGEFALRVPEGQEYELVVREKHYKEVNLKFKAASGELEQKFSVRLETADTAAGGVKQ